VTVCTQKNIILIFLKGLRVKLLIFIIKKKNFDNLAAMFGNLLLLSLFIGGVLLIYHEVQIAALQWMEEPRDLVYKWTCPQARWENFVLQEKLQHRRRTKIIGSITSVILFVFYIIYFMVDLTDEEVTFFFSFLFSSSFSCSFLILSTICIRMELQMTKYSWG
jgi:hypothetical protein